MTVLTFQETWRIYQRLWQLMKPYGGTLALGVIANIIYSAIDAGFTYMMRPFIDKGLVGLQMAFVHQIPWIILAGITARGFVSGLGGYWMTSVARSVVKTLRQHVFAHILRLPACYYDNATPGQLLSKMLYDVEQVAQVSADALTDLIQNLCLVAGLVAVMMIISWPLSMMFLVTVPFVGLIVNWTNKRIRRVSHRVQACMGDVTEIAAEAIEGYRVVRLFGGEPYETRKFNTATERARFNDLKVAMTKMLNVSGVQGIIAISIAAILFATIHLTSIVHVTAGAFIAIIAAMLQLIKPIKTLTTLNAVIQRGLAGASSVFSLLDTPVESSEGKTLTKRATGAIAFDNVSFAYRPGVPVLNNISFRIAPRETVALVGHSGSGKSTIASLLPRFYELTDGQILLDGESISALSLQSLRSQIGFVSQHVTLFNDTIANNIAYGCPDASRDKIAQAAKLAYAESFINRLPQGFDTLVGDNGVLLSGGQRQRLAIARAFFKDSPILILDEATSALDSESEREIQLALQHVMQHRTTLVIAHRLSTIKNADLILVMKEGNIVEAGTHEALLAKRGEYAQLYQLQGFTNEVFA